MDRLFELSLLIPLVVVAVGVAVWIQGNRRTDAVLKRIAYGILLLAVALVLVSWLVQTPREKVEAGSRTLITSASARDWTTFAGLLHSDVSFKGFRGYADRASFATGAQATVDRIGLRWARPTGVRVEPQANEYIAELDCLSVQEITMDRPLTTSWRLTWAKEDGQWRVVEVEPLPRPQVSPEQITGQLVLPPATP